MDTPNTSSPSDDLGPETPLDRLEDKISIEEASIVAMAAKFNWSLPELAKHLRESFGLGVYAEPDFPPWPVEQVAAGTPEKIELMASRVAMGRRPCHVVDPIYASDDRKFIEADRQSNGRDVNRREKWLWELEEEEDKAWIDYDAIARRWLLRPRQQEDAA